MAFLLGKTELPRYLRVEQGRVEAAARACGLDFFPVVFEMLAYDQMNEIAAYGGLPVRYPHWRFGMEYEQLSKSAEYGLSKIYEMVINNTPSFAYLLEGNSLTDQRMVMCHVYGHVDFFKNNFVFRSTDLDAGERVLAAAPAGSDYAPNRKWIDKFANHAAAVRRIVERYGLEPVEAFIDDCLSLENLIDPYSRFLRRHRAEPVGEGEEEPLEVPRLEAKPYMEDFINPRDYQEEQRRRLERERDEQRGRFPAEPTRDVLAFLLAHAPLERWQRTVLGVIREEAYYFAPQAQTKIMNEGWASYWHSKLMTEHVADWAEMVDYAENNAGVMATSQGRLNPYKLGVQLFRDIEERWDRGQHGRDWEACDDLDEKSHWDLRRGEGRAKLFEVRALHTDVTFIDAFFTEEFAIRQGLYTYAYSRKTERFEIESREFVQIKQRLLGQLTNHGQPLISVTDGNYGNRGELLLKHEHHGVDLRRDYAEHTLRALGRLWRRPVLLHTALEGRPTLLRLDGGELRVEEASAP